MYKFTFFVTLLLSFFGLKAQLVDVVNNSTSGGDVIFGATNFTKTPVFLKVEFTELQNTTNDEIRVYYNKLEPGYNNIFNLTRRADVGAPYFYYKVKAYRSDPVAKVDLKFPYLVPFEPGKTATVFDVKDLNGFWGDAKLRNWTATGFNAQPGEKVFVSRTGEIVEIVEQTRTEKSEFWYNTWTNIITLLQPDGTLISYKNVIDRSHKLRVNQKIVAGQLLGEVAPGSNGIILLIYHNSGLNDDLLFIIPQFVTEPGQIEMINSSIPIEVVHPNEIRGLEMTKREQRKFLDD